MIELKKFSKLVRDPIWNHIRLTEQLYDITKTEPFLRLYNIKQLGPAQLVYPGASHTRAAHSIGVYNAALIMIDSLLQKGASVWVSERGIVSFLTAALLHDLGHFPFTHSLKELHLKEHEMLTGELILAEPLASLIYRAGADPEQTAAVITKKKTADTETVFFQKLLSGVLDPDKMDYLNRDAFYCGVPYGIQDTDFIFSQLLPDKKNGIKLESKAIISVESILFSKYLMYKAVYWHKKVRIATAMMKKAVFAGLEGGFFSPEALYNQDDTGLFDMLEHCRYAERETALALKAGKIYKTAAEIPFDEKNKQCILLENLKERTKKEARIAQLLSSLLNIKIEPKEVLIDIPERISFESDIFIEDEKKRFSESSTVFSEEFINKLVPSLRKIRLAVSERIHRKIIKIEKYRLADFLNII